MERLGAAEHGGQRLHGRADDVVVGLLGREGDACRLCVEAEPPRARDRVAPKRSRMIFAHIRRAARNLATSSRRLFWEAKKKDRREAKPSTSRPASMAACT